MQTNVTERGPMPDLFVDLRARRARSSPPPPHGAGDAIQRDHPPVAAFENYIKGLLAETPATAINYFNAALQA